MRLAFIVLTLLALTGCEAMQAIDQGLYSVSESFTQKDKITGKRTVSSSREEQIKKGNAFIEAAIANADEKGLKYNASLDAKAYARLVRVFDRIQSVSHLKDERWQVLLIPEQSFNASVNGGTYVVVHIGLMNELSDDSELAAVIGHEFAHVAANHIGESSGHHNLASLMGSNSSQRSSFKTAFTHEGEEEADKIGILYSALAGFDPYGAHRVWNRFYKKSGDRSDMFVDHPVYSERAAQTKSVAEQVSQYYKAGNINPNHQSILKSNSLFAYQEDNGPEAGQGGGLASLLSASLQSYTQHLEAKAEEQRQSNRIANIKAVNGLLEVVDIEQLSQTQWRFLVKYTGNRNIGDLSFHGALYQGEAVLAKLQAKPTGYFSPGGQYYVIAQADKAAPMNTNMTAYRFKATEVTIY
ncbi:M48 family metallopeptidase [Amphritea sp. HPY]|uniref:M48 family metallopeptidase n=1 Tax=Amphritea sp. HPY TaxID=3421652 RepID=UPI003D7DAEE8